MVVNIVAGSGSKDKVYRIGLAHQLQLWKGTQTGTNTCVLCQEITGEVLQCSASSTRSMDGAGYTTLADNLLAFKEIDCLPSCHQVLFPS